MPRFKNFSCFLIILSLFCCSLWAADKAPYDLRVGDGIVDPLGYHDTRPRFSWKLADERFGAAQLAYQVRVVSSTEDATLWDSGKVESGQSVYVQYAGEPFTSREKVYWKVRYWDQEGDVSPWSQWAKIEYGLLASYDWSAKWIYQPKVRSLEGIEITKLTYGRHRYRIDVTDAILNSVKDDPDRIFSIRVGEGELFEREERTGSPMALTIDYRENGEDKQCLRWDGQLIEIPPPDACNVPYFRKEFELDELEGTARLYVTARGIFEVEINGKRVGRDAFAPGWTDYFQRIETLTYDVTDYLVEGRNVIGARVAKGWYAGEEGEGIGKLGPSDVNRGLGGQVQEFLCQLEIAGAGGSEVVVATDDSWTYFDQGPVVKSEIYWGEDYDARNEIPGWSSVGYDAAGWKRVEAASLDGVSLLPKTFQTVTVRKVLTPTEIVSAGEGTVVFDMGQNMVGWPAIDLPGLKDKKIRIRVAEMLEQDGSLYIENYRNSRSQATYVPAEDGKVRWRPTFSFFGYRFVEVSGYDTNEVPSLGWVAGEVLHTSFEQTGSFTSSHAKLNQLQSNIEWGQRGNFLDIPTDCPQRNERLGWAGDAQTFSATSLFNFDVHAFWKSWLKTFREHQSEDGRLPVVAPNVGTFWGGPRLSPAWGDAIAIVPWEVYLQTGDVTVLEENYEAMNKYADLYRRRSPNHIAPDTGFGDWLQPLTERGVIDPKEPRYGSTPRPLITTAFFGYTTTICAKVSELLGKEEEAKRHWSELEKIRSAIRREFLDADGRLTTPVETQTGYALLIAFDLVEEDLKPKLGEHLAALVRAENNRLNTGFVGCSYLTRVLDSTGNIDEALAVLFTSEYPSWFYSIDQGATTIWERWNSYNHETGFGDAKMNSFNHYAYGAIGRWMYERLAGLAPDESNPGYKHFIVAPIFESPLEFAEARLETRYGEARTRWEKVSGGIRMRVIVPPNSSATIRIPEKLSKQVRWANAPHGAKLKFTKNDGIAVSEIVAGAYDILLLP
ncbi:family 78 glycoside hydrolase catalytic domain [Pelagicoccus sp. NFK12]|uniref:alpha-L-rhamnosidase n=2 Tax=Pelagicoccus TaxID=455433 RepID=A0A927FDX4_9BACT|nr:alpha-L-rhamnosidase [Pelagicoccus enzymogenes]MBD5781608.1 family 78 glycoside hydrolase catalytic domain [Pelagicoccus enzymogenes]MDQ8181128.1 family 78 glycoside hydrolase catalytic domain [Pelagicoccus sp. SDUM812005]